MIVVGWMVTFSDEFAVFSNETIIVSIQFIMFIVLLVPVQHPNSKVR